jgi:hypothetical protein
MQIEKRTMGWLPKQSSYDYAQSLNAKRRENAQSAIASNEALASTLSGASTSHVAGAVENTIKAAAARIQATAQAKLQAQIKAANS